MALKVAVAAIAAMVLLQAGPGFAARRAILPNTPINPVQYDLSEHGSSIAAGTATNGNLGARDASIGQVTREQASAAAAGRAPPERPSVSYEPMASGPVIELGAFGSKRKGTPGLAHFSVNWDF